ncbi:hypothetical protein ACFVYT_39570, partial [Streptomyces sp. NPDC058290]|uniref:hypothetical protein n=1 Tax=Streptomyces sp. NPDC058290 TaxID=3346426 RepID=UPI0036E337B5
EVDGVSTFGVDFWHAVEFSRNGRFLCTHPLGGFPPGFVLRFQLYQIISVVVSDLDLNSGGRWGPLPFGVPPL